MCMSRNHNDMHTYAWWAHSMGVAMMANKITLFMMLVGHIRYAEASFLSNLIYRFIAFTYSLLSFLDVEI